MPSKKRKPAKKAVPAKKVPPKKAPPKKAIPSKKAPPKKAPPKKSPPKKIPPKKSPPKKIEKSKASAKKSSGVQKSKPSIPATKGKINSKPMVKSNEKPAGKRMENKIGGLVGSGKPVPEVQLDKKKRNYSEIDRDLLILISESDTIFIHDIENALDLNSDEVRKALKRLEQKGKIKTHQEMTEGKWQIEAKFVDNYGLDSQVKKKQATVLIWDTDEIPCYLCPNVKKCRAGQEELNPQKCKDLSTWLDSRIYKKDYVNPYKNQVKDIK